MSTEGPLAHIGGPGLERGSLVSAPGVDEMSLVRAGATKAAPKAAPRADRAAELWRSTGVH